MKISRSALLVVVSLAVLGLASVSGQKAGTRAATERALRQVDAEWAAASQARGL